MEEAPLILSNIEHYRTLLNLYMTDETRQTVQRLLARAECQLAGADAPKMSNTLPARE